MISKELIIEFANECRDRYHIIEIYQYQIVTKNYTRSQMKEHPYYQTMIERGEYTYTKQMISIIWKGWSLRREEFDSQFVGTYQLRDRNYTGFSVDSFREWYRDRKIESILNN